MNGRNSNMRIIFILIFLAAVAVLAIAAHPQQIPRDEAKIPSAVGARPSACFGQAGKQNRIYTAVPPRANRGIEMWVIERRD